VQLQGTNLGTITDIDGKFSLSGTSAEGNYNLIASFVGYAAITQSVAINASTKTATVNFDLKPDILNLDEVVVTGARVTFKPRADMLDEAMSNLNAAAATLAATPVTAANSSLVASNLGFDIDLPNAIQALLARIYTVRGNSASALAAAQKVDLTSKSVWKYDDANRNPLYNDFSTNNISGGNPINFALPPTLTQVDSTDGRLAFYLGSTKTSRVTGFAIATTTFVPVYLPGEITLIKAEAYARTNDLVNATIELNKILTKTTDPFGVTAKGKVYSGAVTQAAILTEIYRQRCIELYLSGQRLEDVRRFGRPILSDPNSESSRKFYPYPNVERDDNPNTPVDPAG